MSEIDWNSELKKIVREYDGLPPEPTPAERRARLQTGQHERERRDQTAGVVAVIGRLALATAVGFGLLQWPYSAQCGVPLAGYLGAVAGFFVASLWAAASSWSHRTARLHVLAVAVVIWSLVLAAGQTLPRVGYAIPDAEHPVRWRCG